jgi:hypothetical protein
LTTTYPAFALVGPRRVIPDQPGVQFAIEGLYQLVHRADCTQQNRSAKQEPGCLPGYADAWPRTAATDPKVIQGTAAVRPP